MSTGMWFALGAFGLWGLLPVYFKLLSGLPPLETLGWRTWWSLVFVVVLLVLRRQWRWLAPSLRDARTRRVFAASAVLIGLNWYLFMWGVDQNLLIECALGYYICPLINVLAGSLLLHERLRPSQWLAAGLAAAGVGWIAWQHGTVPWLALSLAVSFSLYGLVRKVGPLGVLEGLAVETGLLASVAVVGFMLAWARGAVLPTWHASAGLQALLALGGPATVVPLLLFNAATRRLPYSTIGMVQYLGPSISLLVAVWLYDQPFAGAQAQGFVLIWLACAAFSADAWRHSRATALGPV